MVMAMAIQEVDRVEILTLQDNYIDLLARDDTDVVKRALPLKGLEVKNSILAEHGYSALVSVTQEDKTQQILLDCGFSEQGAAFNAEAMGVDLTRVRCLVLSHGHLDHVGGLQKLLDRVGQKDVELVVHPSAFRNPRYMKITETLKVYFPPFTREKIQSLGIRAVETEKPYPLVDGILLFLGEIPRKTEFEKGAPNFFYSEKGAERKDGIEDDTAIVANVKGKGLVILSGCAHAGIINTVKYAQEVTGIGKVFAVMGGFHLTGPAFTPIIGPTTEAWKEMDPTFVVPTHCTGRKAIMYMEKEMPNQFLLNMAGTRMIFGA
jgi:7,8-dihydropterin-6-yl-methyl-4-(beta-D-ribofuranosyl)aminobenzene 5'-phosphate synthase